MLYDESEVLLEGKILKGEEVVRSGESLTFNAYLVDVGDPEGVLKASDGSRDSSMRRKEFKSPSVSVGICSTCASLSHNLFLHTCTDVFRLIFV